VYYIELCAWLGGLEEYKGTNSSFLTIEEVGKFLNSKFRFLYSRLIVVAKVRACTVPVNLKDQDAFHLTIEEYLLALISVVEELVGFQHSDLKFSLITPSGPPRCQLGYTWRL